MQYAVRAGDIDRGGSASAQIKAELSRAGVDAVTARRAGIISFAVSYTHLTLPTN